VRLCTEHTQAQTPVAYLAHVEIVSGDHGGLRVGVVGREFVNGSIGIIECIRRVHDYPALLSKSELCETVNRSIFASKAYPDLGLWERFQNKVGDDALVKGVM
jgi:hypothetical protein